ncbi:MAG: response regulator [Bacteroidales bacterium]|nr:response regulator [Bacteroidales bacterium]
MIKAVSELFGDLFNSSGEFAPRNEFNRITLSFKDNKESLFRKDYFRSSIGLMRLSFLLGIAYYSVFAFLDTIAVPEVRKELFIIRFFVVCPVILIIFLLSYTKNFHKWWQLGSSIATIVSGLGIVVMTIVSSELARVHYYPGAMLVLFYCYMLIKLRFIWSTVSGWLIFILYLVAIITYGGINQDVARINLFFLASANILGMFGGYSLEYYTRKDFFYRYLLKQEREKTEQANERLEKRVQEKTISLRKDIVRRQKIEKELVWAKNKAEESDRLKSAFLANMSHEIRTPMNGILGFTDLLLEPDLDSEARDQYLQTIKNSGLRMLNTVNDLVEISKIDAGITGLNFAPVNINKKIREICDFFEPEAHQKGLNLIPEISLPDKDSLTITDESKIESIFTNLIKNALKYSVKGTIRFGYDLNDNVFRFYCMDEGIGIPGSRHDGIFNRFEQADIADKDVYEGSGLGLAITKSYVEMLGGSIWVESEEGEGSVFYFTLPAESEDGSGITKRENREPNKNLVVNKGKILIVDDDVTSLQYLQIILKSEFETVYTAHNGEEALRIVHESENIDYILMDLKMPGMSGYEATRKIREKNPEVRIIAQTAYALEGDRDIAIEAGCDGYISKPVRKEQLFEILNIAK